MNRIILFLLPVLLFAMSCKQSNKTNPENISHETGDAVIDGLSKQLESNPYDLALLFERANAYYEREAYDQAIGDLSVALQIDSLNPDYYHLISDVFMDYQKSRLALSAMLKAREFFPDRIPTLLKLSETQHILRLYEESILTVNDIVLKDPQNAEAYFMLGMNFRAQEEIEMATNSFQTAIEFDPELLDAWLILGNLYEQQGDTRAKEYYESAERIDPNSVSAKHSLAYYLQNHGQEDKAVQLYKDIIKIDEKYSDAYLNMGILLLEKDSLERAFEQFNILANVNPTNHYAYYYRGLTYQMMGKTEEAKNDFQSSINLDDSFAKAKEALRTVSE